jgi:hypothetical protein
MGGTHTAAEIKAAKIKAMPAPLGELHCAFFNEVAHLHLRWSMFGSLFMQGDERIDTLNRTAPFFFSELQGLVFDDVLLHIGRLTDHPIVAGHPTLTLRMLPDHIPDPTLRNQVQQLVTTAITNCEKVREWRNRKLAHTELPAISGVVPKSLPELTPKLVTSALDSLAAIVNCIQFHYERSTTEYSFAMAPGGWIDSLVSYLEMGLKAERAELSRV